MSKIDKFKNRSTAIDCLRGFAIISVISYHYSIGGQGFITNAIAYGIYGVMLFFLISGYCIAISADSSANAWNFYAKRLGRLLPALFVCGFLTTLLKQITLIFPERNSDWSDFFYTLLALPSMNVLGLDYRHPDGAYWSLVVEFFFYGLIVFVIFFDSKKVLISRVAFGSIALTILSVLGVEKFKILVPYLPYFLAGFSLKSIYSDGQKILGGSYLILAFALAIFGLINGISDPSMPSSFVGLGAFAVCILIFVVFIELASLIEKARHARLTRSFVSAFSWIGIISYPLYLLHQDIGLWFIEIIRRYLDYDTGGAMDVLVRSVVLPCVIILLASWVYIFVERPLVKPLTLGVFRCPSRVENILLDLFHRAGVAAPSRLKMHLVLIIFIAFSFVLGFGISRAFQSKNVDSTLAVLSKLLREPVPRSISPWGEIIVTNNVQSLMIDVHNVPASACLELINNSSRLAKVRIVAVNTKSEDEMNVPVSWISAQYACFSLKRKVIRIIIST